MNLRTILTCAALAITGSAHGHNFWENGEEVPAWVKSSCCGKADSRHLKASAVHLMADGYHIDGLDVVVPEAKALPSPDNNYWGFWNPAYEPNPLIYCLFVPFRGT